MKEILENIESSRSNWCVFTNCNGRKTVLCKYSIRLKGERALLWKKKN